MTRFWKKFLREGQGMFSLEPKPGIYLGAFGKHPGWEDHIDDIGLETESLLLTKQILYVEGIGGQISSGEWEKLGEAQRLIEFQHVFVWKRGDAFLVGKIWSSRDGKNRTKYPMIACAHCLGIPFDWALIKVLRTLDDVETLCKRSESADGVREVLGRTLVELRGSLPNVDSQLTLEGPNARAFIERLRAGENQEGLYRIVYCVHTQLARYLAGAKRSERSDLRPGRIRLPAAIGLATVTLAFWSRFLGSQIAKDVPVLLTLPLQEPWVDAICGEPTSKEFYSLRARPEVISIASELPYSINDEFRNAHTDVIEAMLVGNGGKDS